jgi:deoxyribose-phosphate aldolase
MTDCPPIADLARMIDHSALHPTMTDRELEGHCATARDNGCASICIKPYAVPMARARLAGSATAVCTVIGFPHGSNAIGIKVAETLRACDEGATEIDLVVNIGKVLSEDWGYLAAELGELQAAVVSRKAISKVIFEVDFLKDAHIVKLCRLCSDAGVHFVKTSTGYGYVKQANGDYNYKGATSEALKLMAANVAPGVQLKAAGGVRTLDDLLRVRALGCTRVGATATVAILDEARKRHGLAVSGKPATASASGY